MAPNEKDLVQQPGSRLKRDRQNCMQALVTQFKISVSIVTKINSAQILLNWDLGLEEGAHPMVSCTEGPCPLAAGVTAHSELGEKRLAAPAHKHWGIQRPPHIGRVVGTFPASSQPLDCSS